MSKSNWEDIIGNIYEPEKVSEFKRKFAKLLVKYNDDVDRLFSDRSFLIMFDGNTACHLYAYNNWQYDEEVIKIKGEIIENDLEDILPTKTDIALKILEIADQAYSPSDKLNALKEYIVLQGFKSETEGNAGGNNVVIITDKGSNMTWEEQLLKNQQDLQEQGEQIANGTYKKED